MELRQLEYFTQVARTGSFLGAARHLDVSQPSLWRSVKSLESELGIMLFERSGRGVQPTNAGTQLLGAADALLARAGSLRQLGADLARGRAGLVRIDCAYPHVSRFLAPLIGAFAPKHPDIRVVLHEHSGLPALERVLAGDVDLATGLTDDRAGLRRQKLGSVRLVVITADSHRWRNKATVRTAQLRDEPLLLGSAGSLTRRLLEPAMRAAGFEAQIAMESPNASTLVAMARQGLGVAVLADDNLAGDGQRWPRLADPRFEMSTDVWLYSSSERPLSAPVRSFLASARSGSRRGV